MTGMLRVILIIVLVAAGVGIQGPVSAETADDGVNTLVVTVLDNGGTVAGKDGVYRLQGSLGLPVQGSISDASNLVIRSGFWFGSGRLAIQDDGSRVLFMILPVLAGGAGS